MSTKTKKKIVFSYLYADGHAILVYEKEDKDAGTIQFVEIHEKWTDARLSFKGRLTFSRYSQEMLHLAKRAHRIEADEPSVKNGSENTQKMNIAVGTLSYEMTPEGYCNALYWTSMPDLITPGFSYQPQNEESCPSPDESFWGNYRVSKFHRAVKAEPLQSIAA